MAHDVFISYAAQDKPIADAVCGILEGNRIRCWIAPRDILAGEYGKVIINAINGARVMVIVFSSSTNESKHVKREAEIAVERGIAVLPFRVEAVLPSNSLKYILTGLHWLDALTPPLEDHIHRLAETVGYLLNTAHTENRNDAASGLAVSPEDDRSKKQMVDISGLDPERRQQEEVVVEEKIADGFVSQGKLVEALELFRTSLRIHEQFVSRAPDNPKWQRRLAANHEKIGIVLVLQGNLTEALRTFRVSLEIRNRFARLEPENSVWLHELSLSHEKIGDVLVSLGDLPGALHAYRTSIGILERLASSDPGNAAWQRDLSATHIKIGGLFVVQRNTPEARSAYHAGLEISERLLSLDPGNREWRRDLALSYFRWGTVCYQTDAPDEALSCMRRCYEILKPISVIGKPMDTKAKDVLDKVTKLLGER